MTSYCQIIDLGILFASFLVIGILRKNYNVYLNDLFKLIFNYGNIEKFTKASNVSMMLFLYYSFLVFLFSMSAFVYHTFFYNEYLYISEGIKIFGKIIFLIVIIKFFQFFVYYFIGSVTYHKYEARLVINTDLITSVIGGFIVLLPSTFYPYISEELQKIYIYFALFIFGTLFIIKIIYGLIFVFKKMSLLHIILLILSVEVLPVIVSCGYICK